MPISNVPCSKCGRFVVCHHDDADDLTRVSCVSCVLCVRRAAHAARTRPKRDAALAARTSDPPPVVVSVIEVGYDVRPEPGE